MEYFNNYYPQIIKRQKLFDAQAKYLPHITYEPYQIMVMLYLSDRGAVPRKVLQKVLNLNGSCLTRSTQALIKAGFIYYEVDINDLRLKLIRLTALGLQMRELYLDVWIPAKDDEHQTHAPAKG